MSFKNTTFEVTLDTFHGPFDLLYELVANREFDIYEVPLAQITREYLHYIRKLSDIDVNTAGDFLLIAAVLMELKSKSLFPKDMVVDEVELIDPHEARQLLVQRLLEYKIFKNASGELLNRYDAFSRYFPREAEPEELFARVKPDFYIGFTPEDLYMAYTRVLRSHDEIVDASHMIGVKYSVEEKANKIINKLKNQKNSTFKALTDDCRDRMEVVFYFLALLELLKDGEVICSQSESFGEIEIELRGDDSFG